MKFRITYTIEAESLAEALVEIAYPRVNRDDERDTSRFSEVRIEKGA